MPSQAKQPQDRQPKKKSAKRLRDEAQEQADSVLGSQITVDGRLGSVTVTILDDPLEWDADVMTVLDGWVQAKGIVVTEAIPLLKRIISLEDGERVEAIRPTRRSAQALAESFLGLSPDGDAEQDDGGTVGESQAS